MPGGEPGNQCAVIHQCIGLYPLEVGEVLAVGQTVVPGIDAESVTEHAAVLDVLFEVIGEHITVLSHDIEGEGTVELALTIHVLINDQLDAQTAAQTCSVEANGSLDVLAVVHSVEQVVGHLDTTLNMDVLPTGIDVLLPCDDVTSQCVVVGLEFVGTLRLRHVELAHIVVNHARHGVVGGNLSQRLLDVLNPLG